MSQEQKYQELQQSHEKLTEQYNTLVEKNQNDLIKIKQKQKTFNDTLQAMKQERQSIHTKYKTEIDVLSLQVNQMKIALSSKNDLTISPQEQQELRDNIESYKKEVFEMNQIIEMKTDRVEEVEQNSRKLMDQNIVLTADNAALKATLQESQRKYQQLQDKIKELQNVQKIENRTGESQTDLSGEIVGEKDHKRLISDFNNQIKKMNSSEEEKEKEIKKMKEKVRDSTEELKRYIQRDRKNNALLKKKNQEIEKLHDQVQHSKKSVKVDRKKFDQSESCLKCKELEQENKLLHEMIKSAKTMVRVREIEVQKYRNKQTLNNSKVHDRMQTKKSRGDLPPLKKN